MNLTSLIETSVVSDLAQDSRIAQFPINVRGKTTAKSGDESPTAQPALLTTTVSAREVSEFFGTGIKRVAVEVEIRTSLASDARPNSALLDEIESAVNARLQPSYPVCNSSNVPITGRETDFSGPKHKVFGITADGIDRGQAGLEQWRTVKRMFIATLLP